MPTVSETLAAGLSHFRAGRFEQAARACRAVLEVQPDHAQALDVLGVLALQRGDSRSALAHFSRAVAANPDNPDLLNHLGAAQDAAGTLDRAVACYQQALRLRPDFRDVHNNLGVVLQKQGKLPQAAEHLLAAIRLDVSYADAHSNLGLVFRRLGRLAEAIEHYRQAVSLKPDSANFHMNLGVALRDAGQFDEALEQCRRAVELNPGSAPARNNLGNSLMDVGQIDDAIAQYRRAIELQPTYGQPYSNLAHARKSTDADRQELQQFEAALAAPGLSPSDRSELLFALGKMYNDLTSWDRAFDHYHQANQLLGQRFNRQAFTDYVDAITAAYTPQLFREKQGLAHDASELPILIVGMPRAGTTLVEQILASHPSVFGAGELTDIARMTSSLPQRLHSKIPYPACVRELDAAVAGCLADEYVSRLSAQAPGATRVVDKMMTNYLHLGLIALILPGAKVIHCRRNPLDVCLSCYFQNFSHRPAFASDLGTLGFYHRQYARLMAHWQAVRPIRVFELHYEQLVDDPDRLSRDLLAFCGLDWHPDCLQFHANRRAVRTASNWQVRQPLHRRSVGRWRNYERHLGPLKASLGEGEQADAATGEE